MAGGIAFNQVPGDIRVPGFFAEVNAGPPPYSGISRTILLGRADTTICAANTLVNIGDRDPNEIAGPGTIGADMILHARRENPTGEMLFMALADPVSGVKAAGAFTVTGTALRNGTITRYIAGERYEIVVRKGMTAAIIAARLIARINSGYLKYNRQMKAPVVASVGSPTSKVVLTAVHEGVEGNEIRLTDTRLDGDEQMSTTTQPVPGVTVAVTPMAGGLGGADLEGALAAIATEPADFIAGPYSSVGALDTIRDFLGERWAPLVSLDGHYFTAKNGTLGDLTAYGVTRNDPHVTIVGTLAFPHPSWVIAATVTGQVSFSKSLGRPLSTALEIARPMQTLVLSGLRAPQNSDSVFGFADRDSLLRNGISTLVVRPDKQIACDRIITTYRTNDAGLLDITFLDIESLFIAAYVKRFMRNRIQGRYPRHVLREDNPGALQGVATPDALRATVIHAYEELYGAGIVRQADRFAQLLRVAADYENDRANFYLPISKAAALRIFGVNITMFLNLTPAAAQL